MTHDLSVLHRYSTPTVANAIELFDLRPRNEGFLRPGLLCLQPDMPPIAGFAATCLVSGDRAETYGRREPLDYWGHVESIAGPRISVVQDLDPYPGTGCFWGEVNSNIHLALGCVGTVTDGAIRDLPEMRRTGIQALYRYVAVSHSYIHIANFGSAVNIDGTVIRPGDLLQADMHGVLIVPVETLPHLEDAVKEMERREKFVIDFCKSKEFNREGLATLVSQHLRNAAPWKPGGQQ